MRNGKWYVYLIAVGCIALFTAQGSAFPLADGCRTCHPTFQGGFGNQLHDMHLEMLPGNNCGLCHTNVPDIPDVNESSDGISCIGCHVSPGLWEHHLNEGISCAPCHTTWPTPDPESTLPPNYTRADVSLTNPCETDRANGGEDYSGDGEGLDNDGDLLYDFDDPDCTVQISIMTWGQVKAIYRK